MKKSNRFLITALILGAYLLSACNGTIPRQDDSSHHTAGSTQSTETVFTGSVESQNGTQWLISGQLVNIDESTLVDPNLQVGDVVKVEASVSADGTVIAVKLEPSSLSETVANDNSANGNGDNSNANTNDNTNSSNNNAAPADPGQETFGVVDAVTDTTITVDSVTYGIEDFTEFKGLIAVGDQVKIHVIVNADGTLTIREIEKFTGTSIGNDNSNNNDSSYNNNGNDNSNYNSNSNDDEHDDHDSNDNSNGNDDEHDD